MIEHLEFGRSGHLSTRALLGAAGFSRVSQAEADAALEIALAYGVNHIDTAASYGEAELRIGSWIQRHGKIFFLATKTGERTASKAMESIQRSLDRLHVDQVDLLQLHNLVDPQEWETALGPGGALEAAVEAQRQGLVRFIGVTGHGLSVAKMHLRALERYDFDSVLLPFSYILAQDSAYLAEFNALKEICQSRRVAVQTIKSIVRAPWGERPQTRATWYEPLETQADIDLAVHWVLGHPGLFLNTVGDVHVLPRVLDAASRFQGMPSEVQMEALVQARGMEPLFA
jgi:aryl-alcohol dehydrogenase-like predicted oxidoreductase